MNVDYATWREERRRRILRHLPWLIPVALLAAVGLFFGLGHLVRWLWSVTLVDIFAIKPISFWQAWGLILLSQILFKANMQPSTHTRRHWRHRRESAPAPTGEATP